ncbi:cytochrome C [Azospirillum sp. TSO35-2]|nr:cytochrome C [Azospirillum sp. TSO35-2]
MALAVIAAAAGAAWQGVQQRQKTLRHVAEITGGDPHAGQEAVLRYGCGSCHTIPGVTRARGLVGPPLAGFGSRVYVAGVLANTPDNVMSWIKDPPAASPRTAMPNLGVSDQDARDITAYLYTLTEGHW